MLRRFFQSSTPREVVDPAFGSLSNDKHGNWKGRIRFEPLNQDIDISIRCPHDQAPTEVHRDFFALLATEWPKIHDELRANLFVDLPDWSDGTTMEKLFESLEFRFFNFWDLGSSPRLWEIAATTSIREEWVFNITMLDLTFKVCAMDD
jgi:hypothetical protein